MGRESIDPLKCVHIYTTHIYISEGFIVTAERENLKYLPQYSVIYL